MTEEELINYLDCDGRETLSIASDLDTPVEVLTKLAEAESFFVRCRVAANPNTPAEVLAKLAEDGDCYLILAGNPNTPAEAFFKIACSRNWCTRFMAASHPNIPEEVLNILSDDPDPEVRYCARLHPKFKGERPSDPEFLERIYQALRNEIYLYGKVR